MEPKSSIPYSQEPATRPYSEPDQPVHAPTSSYHKIHFNIILPSAPESFEWSFSFLQVSLPKPCRRLSPTCYMHLPFHSSWFVYPNNVVFFHFPVTSSLLGPNVLPRIIFSNVLSIRSSLIVSDQVSHPFKEEWFQKKKSNLKQSAKV